MSGMVIKVRLVTGGKVVEVNGVAEISARELAEKLGILLSENLLLRNNEVLTEDDLVRDGDEIIVFTVKSGG